MTIFLSLTKYFFGGKIWIQIQTINHTKSYGRNSLMKTLETKKAPAAIGPYSQAKMTGNFLFASGQIPVDPATGEVAGDKIETQAEQSCKNVGAILEEAGLTLTMLSRLHASLLIWQISLHSTLCMRNTSQANRPAPALL